MILKLNEPQNNLQLIKIDNNYILVDLVAEITKNTIVIFTSELLIYKVEYTSQCNDYNEDKDCFKIIFASQSLNLEGVKVIEEDDIEINIIVAAQQYALDNMKYNGSASLTRIKTAWEKGCITGYNQTKENTFSLEQLKEAIELAKEGNIGYYAPDCPNYYFDNSEQDIINSLNLLSVEITFDENNQPLTAKFIK